MEGVRTDAGGIPEQPQKFPWARIEHHGLRSRQGAADARERFSVCSMDNDAYRYAMTRNILYRKGKVVETLAAFEPDFAMMNEWYKQLFGESEGKDQKGLMASSCRMAAGRCSRPM